MRKVIITLALMLMACTVQSTTLQGMIDKFRIRIAETDTTESVLSDSSVKVLINLALQKIVPMAGYVEKSTKFAFSRDSTYYALPSTFRGAKNVMLLSAGKWYAVAPDVPQAQESPVSKYTIAWINPDSAELRISLGEVIQTYTDMIYNEDSAFYTLPVDYMKYGYVTYWSSEYYRWYAVYDNVGFQKDTTVKNGYVFQKHPDTALYFYKDELAVDEDTIRLSYVRTMTVGDTIEVQYIGDATLLVALSDVLDVPGNLEPFVIDEAIIYYHDRLRDEEKVKNKWQILRTDMGLLKPGQ
jgi:hypothetical protein